MYPSCTAGHQCLPVNLANRAALTWLTNQHEAVHMPHSRHKGTIKGSNNDFTCMNGALEIQP